MKDAYLSVAGEAEHEMKIERSRFIGHVKPVSDVKSAKMFIDKISNAHKQATHNCPAFRLGIASEETVFYSDAGEPNGTAGKPIYGSILKHQVTDLVVVVTRYFGGKKLGIRGLIEAYGLVSYETIAKARLIEKKITAALSCECEYSNLGKVEHIIEKFDATITQSEYTTKVSLKIQVPISKNNLLAEQLKHHAHIRNLENENNN